MSRLPLWVLVVLLAILALPGSAVLASDLSPGTLRIDGEDDWHAERELHFDWQPSPPPGQPFQSVYRLYDAEGKTVRGEARPLKKLLYPIPAPPLPGVYTLEMWLENEAGGQGSHSTATFRFDDTAPPTPTLQPPPGWVLEGEPALLSVGLGAGTPPLSGIRGYTISIGDSAEINLTAAGSVSLGVLPEGVYSVRGVAVSGSGVASLPQTTTVRVDGTPPVISLEGAPSGWSDGPVQLTVLAGDELSGMTATGPLGASTAIAVDGASAAWVPGDTASTAVAGSGLHRVEYFARDAAGNVTGGGSGTPIPASATIRIDEDPPAVAFAPAQDPADPERIEASVSDALSGPSPEHGWIEVRPLGTGSKFEQLPTRVIGERLIARWDSDSYPQGRYEFRAIGVDRAGNATTGTNRDLGGKMVLPNPLKLPVSLEAGFAGKRSAPAARRARFGRGVLYSGLLLTAAGAPVAGVEVAVTESFGAGSKLQRRTTTVRTGADGRFQIRLAPGPSRQVTATFAGNRTLTRALSKETQLEVPTSVRLRASAATARIGGAPVVFSGQVARKGTKASAVAGLAVELQFRFRNGKWSEFRTVETDARGRFRYPYRFSDDDSRGVRFQFRAHVKGREGWPYGPSASRPVLVTGR